EAQRLASSVAAELDEAEFATYGHIVVDEAQDLSPMELRVLKRRDLSGSMTIVGDMGQATSASSPASWDALLAVLEPRRPPRRVDLTVSYRTPAEVLDFAAPTLAAATPDLQAPRPVRRVGVVPDVIEVEASAVAATVAAAARRALEDVAPGRVAVIVPDGSVRDTLDALGAAGLVAVDPRVAGGRGLSADLVVVPAEGAHGLEFDAVVVVGPGRIAARGAAPGEATSARGLRTLYVALTRPTRRLSVVAGEALPASVRAALDERRRNERVVEIG
ncbi:MAG: helicase, partial [Acidimicrobiales bacterium]